MAPPKNYHTTSTSSSSTQGNKCHLCELPIGTDEWFIKVTDRKTKKVKTQKACATCGFWVGYNKKANGELVEYGSVKEKKSQ